MLIIELTKTDSNKATVSLIISDSGNETLLDTAESVTFNWGQNSENSVSFLKYDEGEARVFINRSTALRFDNDADLNAFVDDNFAEGGMPAVQSLGDAMSVYVARGVSELVYMSDPAAGWKPGARNENAEFVYGADGSVGIEHTNSTSHVQLRNRHRQLHGNLQNAQLDGWQHDVRSAERFAEHRMVHACRSERSYLRTQQAYR